MSPSPGTASGAAEESCIKLADGNRSELQQTAPAPSRVFPRAAGQQGAIDKSIRPLLRLSRDSITRLQRIESALIRSLQRDPLLAERVRRLQTIPCVGRITALTWALEMGDISRFRSIRQAISYCGLCGDEKRSAETAVRTPLSKQRNKHIQRVLVEAAKLAPRYDPDLALFYAREKQSGNANRATHRGCRGGCSPSPSPLQITGGIHLDSLAID